MLEKELSNRLYSYVFYSAAMAMFLASVFSFNIYFLAFAIALLLGAALSFSSGHLINSMLLKHTKTIDLYNGFRLNERFCAATKKNGNDYFSISVAILKRSNEEVTKEDLVESLISSIDFPFDFSLGIRSVNRSKVLEGLETKRRIKEIEITRSDQKKYDRINRLKRELNIIENEIRSIRECKPLAVEAKIKAYGVSRNEIESARESEKNIGQVAGMFSSMLGFEYEILKGEVLLEEVSLQREIV